MKQKIKGVGMNLLRIVVNGAGYVSADAEALQELSDQIQIDHNSGVRHDWQLANTLLFECLRRRFHRKTDEWFPIPLHECVLK